MYSREIIEEAKAGAIAEAKKMSEINQFITVTGDRFDIPAIGRSINIVYYKAKRKNAPLVFGYHGGGFLFGGNAMNDDMWSAVRDALDVNVASVDYRQSPDYRYMEALDDAYEAAVYMKNHHADFDFDPNDISVMGCSAGACLAATVCLYAAKKDEIKFKNQILMYPFLDAATDPDSKGGGSIQGPIMYVFNELHCSPEEAKLSIVSPVFASREELIGQPRAIFCMADDDCLKLEGYKYAEMLKNAGVSVSVTECKGMPHGFFESGFGEISEGEMDFLGEKVLNMIKSGEISRASIKALEFIKNNI